MQENDLILKSQWLRKTVFEMTLRANQGHIGSVLSEIDILVALFYGGVMRYTPGNPRDPNRDRMLISKGHAAMALYPIYADLGYFVEDELERFGTPDGLLRIFGHIGIPGIDATLGSLGHGLGVGAGFALADKRDGKGRRTFVIISEGELYEGSVWESALFASHHKLDNLVVILDRNRRITLGATESLVRLEPIEDKWRSFGWKTATVDGHSFESLLSGFAEIDRTKGKPFCFIANTVKGKGISFMEDRTEWHYWLGLDEAGIAQARKDLETNYRTD